MGECVVVFYEERRSCRRKKETANNWSINGNILFVSV